MKRNPSTSRSHPLRHPVALTAFALVLVAHSAWAHPGHDLAEHGVTHILTSPYHGITLFSVGLVSWLIARKLQQPMARRALQGLGVVATMSAAILWGLRF